MTELRLYHGVAAPIALLVKLLVKRLLPQRQSVVVMAVDHAQASEIDKQLWTFSPITYVPHAIIGDGCPDQIPVTIAYPESSTPPVRDVLISLVPQVQDFACYLHYITILEQQLDELEQLHEKLCAYQGRGHRLEDFNMSAAHG